MSDTHASPDDAAPEGVFRCEVAPSDLEAFVACLALGALEAMRSGSWPTEAGIWTLARPVFRRRLESAGLPGPLLDVLQRADELSALEELAGRSAAQADRDRPREPRRNRVDLVARPVGRAGGSEGGGPRTVKGAGSVDACVEPMSETGRL